MGTQKKSFKKINPLLDKMETFFSFLTPLKVKKGDELGYFQFGGSTHCLVFQKDVTEDFLVSIDEDVEMGQLITLGK